MTQFDQRRHDDVMAHLVQLHEELGRHPSIKAHIKTVDHDGPCSCSIVVYPTGRPNHDNQIIAASADHKWYFWWLFIERIGGVDEVAAVANHVVDVIAAKGRQPEVPL